MGMYRSAGDVGFVIGPPLLGAIADWTSYSWAIVVNGALQETPAHFNQVGGAYFETIEMNAPSRAYSMMSWPSSSRMKRAIRFFMSSPGDGGALTPLG